MMSSCNDIENVKENIHILIDFMLEKAFSSEHIEFEKDVVLSKFRVGLIDATGIKRNVVEANEYYYEVHSTHREISETDEFNYFYRDLIRSLCLFSTVIENIKINDEIRDVDLRLIEGGIECFWLGYHDFSGMRFSHIINGKKGTTKGVLSDKTKKNIDAVYNQLKNSNGRKRVRLEKISHHEMVLAKARFFEDVLNELLNSNTPNKVLRRYCLREVEEESLRGLADAYAGNTGLTEHGLDRYAEKLGITETNTFTKINSKLGFDVVRSFKPISYSFKSTEPGYNYGPGHHSKAINNLRTFIFSKNNS